MSIHIEPQQLQFPCTISNMTYNYAAFMVKTTNPKKYCVRPNTGVVSPRSTCDVIVTIQAQKEAPADMHCKDQIILQTVVASPGTTTKDVTTELFSKESGHHVEECKLRVVYVAPPRPPSPVREGSEKGSSPGASVSENGNTLTSEFTAAPRTVAERVDLPDNSAETWALISKLTEEKNSAIQQNTRLQQELELLKREANRSHVGVPFMYVVLNGLIGIILGFILKRT